MSKSIWDFTFQELVDWARGHILVSIGKGEYEQATSLIVDQSITWSRKIADKQHAVEVKKLKKEIRELKKEVQNQKELLGDY